MRGDQLLDLGGLCVQEQLRGAVAEREQQSLEAVEQRLESLGGGFLVLSRVKLPFELLEELVLGMA